MINRFSRIVRAVPESILRQNLEKACPALESALLTHPHPDVPRAALSLSAELGGSVAIDAVVKAFDRDPPLCPLCLRAFTACCKTNPPSLYP
jgi:hypothetical protein